jgi:uncharacterized protein YndB with AHSA1/START domain
MHAERTVIVARPADEVFDFLAAGPRCTRWRDGIREIARMTAHPGVGAVYRQVMIGPGGYDIDCDYLVTGYDPPRRLDFAVVAGPARPTGSFELTDVNGDHTQVTFRLDASPRGLRRLMAPLWARVLRHQVAQLERLKTVLEGARSAV